jgi:hypothetical protein
MKILLINVKPFTFSQDILIYENGEEIECITVPMNTLEDNIVFLAHKNNTTDVNLVGPKIYINGIKRKIQKAEFAKYKKNNLNIKIV